MQLKRRTSDRGLMLAAKHMANGACAGILSLAMATSLFAQSGQRGYNQIYNFNSVVGPTALTGSGNTLYGATQEGGSQGVGSVYSLTMPATPGNPWTLTTLYSFVSGSSDGINPYSVAIGGFSGSLPILYGTCSSGGKYGKGTVFRLVPPQTTGGTWTEQILHNFHHTDGATPLAPLAVAIRPGQLPILYGTTGAGGASPGFGSGTIFSLTPPTTQGGGWTEDVLYSVVSDGTEGQVPNNVVLGSGPGGPVLYGFAVIGGTLGGGVVFSLAESGSTWTYSVLYNLPQSVVISSPTSLTLGSNGVLYGTAAPTNEPSTGGEVYSLTPPTSEGGAWTENTVYTFGAVFQDGVGPRSVFMGTNGNLYGVTSDGGTGAYGTVFALTPPASPGGLWTENVLYNFPFNGETGGPTSLAIGPQGALYGTTDYIGGFTVSTVFELQP